MMVTGFDIIGWAEAAPGTGTVGLTKAVGDTLYTRGVGDNIRIRPQVQHIIGVLYLAETTPGWLRFKQASDTLFKYLLAGADINLDPTPGYHHKFYNPIAVLPGEDMAPESNNATDEDTLVAMMLSDGPMVNNFVTPDHILRGTSDQTLTALTWTACAVVWSETPPKGSYYITHMRVGSYLAAAYGGGIARLTGLKTPQFRPGVPLELATGDKVVTISSTQYPLWCEWPMMQNIQCEHDDLPDIEVLSPFANTDHVVELGLKRV